MLAESIDGFGKILSGELDELPEQAFYLAVIFQKQLLKAVTLK
jgi:F-type H+-transporting ATPase subunit beta